MILYIIISRAAPCPALPQRQQVWARRRHGPRGGGPGPTHGAADFEPEVAMGGRREGYSSHVFSLHLSLSYLSRSCTSRTRSSRMGPGRPAVHRIYICMIGDEPERQTEAVERDISCIAVSLIRLISLTAAPAAMSIVIELSGSRGDEGLRKHQTMNKISV